MNTKHAEVRRPRRLWLGFVALLGLASSCTLIVGTFEQATGTQSGCNSPADCPDPANACVFNTCTNHVCGTQPQAIGFNLTPNATHDCHGTQCDGNGNIQPVLDVMNLPVETNPCVKGTCSADGTPGTSMVTAGTTCMTNQVCDGSGNCVACLQASDCASGMACTASHMCVPAGCMDGVKNGNETDTDCGGGTCGPCADGKACGTNTDCIDKVCQQGVCQVPTCTDGVQNGGETDTDCGGGSCPTCGPNLSCMTANDCTGKQCGGGKCTPDCSDGVKNNAETDIDCGGGTCPACALTKTCSSDADCLSSACDANTHVCIADQCKDHTQDGNETAVDCGGGTCGGCLVGQHCTVPGDCASAACDTGTMLCVSTRCMDGVKDDAETDIDCGGNVCPQCANNKDCLVDSDCTSGACDVGQTPHVCIANQCADHQQDGQETDIDCGGPNCPTCANGKKCSQNSDCTSTACDNVKGTCAAGLCSDEKQDGLETDTDCGGGASGSGCSACALNKKCLVDSDCGSGACNWCVSPHVCISNACLDCQKDGSETDVDCGATCGTLCANGKGCVNDSDCQSNACDGNSPHVCDASQCPDHRQDGSETDIDCGGPTSGCATRCAQGQKCLVDSDCASNACDASLHVCDTSQCVDGQKDGNETDVDCGGSDACPRCANGFHCLLNTDCSSGVCDNVSTVCVATFCTDQRQDGNETDIDCGGASFMGQAPCPACAQGLKCQVDSDCQSNACDGITLTCDPSGTQCSDHRQDGLETDVDCGGTVCTKCVLGKKCNVDTDCTSNACSLCTSTHTCVSNQCADCQKDGSETDIDCGGSCCTGGATGCCNAGQKCLTNFDCASPLSCNAGTHLCG